MIVLPAIDLRGGRAVRLVHGRPQDQTVYGDDPVAIARGFADAGAGWLHVVDLDAALGTGSNRSVVQRIVEAVPVPVQVGGGLRSMDDVAAALAAGAARAVVGTEALRPGFLGEVVGRFGDRIVAAVDCEGDEVRVRGWTEAAGPVEEVLRRLDATGAPRFLVTAIGRDGTLEGPDLALCERVRGLTDRPVLASGGIRSVEDLEALAEVGVEGAVVGKALYEGTLDLASALAVAS